jgi:hypothetical protein
MEEAVNILKRKYKFAADYAPILGGYIAIFFILDLIFPGNAFVNVLGSLGLVCTPIVCYYLAKRYRDKALGGYIRFGQVWNFGIWLFLFTSLLMSVLYYVQCQFLQPDYLTTLFNDTLKMMNTMKYPKESMDAWIAFGVLSPIEYVFIQIWIYLFGGSFIFLFVSPLVTRKKSEDTSQISNLEKPYEPFQNKNDSKS